MRHRTSREASIMVISPVTFACCNLIALECGINLPHGNFQIQIMLLREKKKNLAINDSNIYKQGPLKQCGQRGWNLPFEKRCVIPLLPISFFKKNVYCFIF